MNTKEELESLGYTMASSNKCPVVRWGKWQVLFKKRNGIQVAGYGIDELTALEDTLKTARKLEENLHITP